MKHSLFVISDLHLGGAPARGDKPGFQMCSPAGQAMLASFIRWVARQRSAASHVHLLINGDVVDFLAEEAFSSFTYIDAQARGKLKQAIDHSAEVWKALREFVGAAGRLTLLLGNHDTELSLPAARRLLLETLGPGQVEFLYDNQAYVEGPVLIEHGNRYDSWNAISHGKLRAIRSALSRGEAPEEYLGPPGSQLVQSVMNPIKKDYPFVDLLKPEGPGMVPVLALLNPAALKKAGQLAALAAKSLEVQFDKNGIPRDQQNIAGYVSADPRDEAQLRLARELAGIPDQADISALEDLKGLLGRLKDSFDQAVRKREVDLLLKALRNFAKEQRQTFNVNAEDETYLRPARASIIERGFKVVIYGHTHLVKRIGDGMGGGLYLNTGTWADLMKMPEGILNGDEAAARAQLERFLGDLREGKLDGWRRQVPTFARVDYDDGKYVAADVFLFDGTKASPVPDGRLTLLDHT